jgi:hypothetical protein
MSNELHARRLPDLSFSRRRFDMAVFQPGENWRKNPEDVNAPLARPASCAIPLPFGFKPAHQLPVYKNGEQEEQRDDEEDFAR